MKTENNMLDMKIAEVKEHLNEITEERTAADPESISELDKEIRKLKRHLKALEDSAAMQNKTSDEKPLDEVTKCKLHIDSLFEQAALAKVDFNNLRDYRLNAAVRLHDAIGRLEMMMDSTEDQIMNISEFPDIDQFLVEIMECITDKNEKINNSYTTLQECESQVSQFEEELHCAEQSADIEKIIKCADQLEDAKKKSVYAKQLYEKSCQMKVLPDGIISQVWKKVCDIYGYEYRIRLDIIRTAAQIYHQGINDLKVLSDYLTFVRSEIQRLGKENGSTENIVKYNPIITQGILQDDIHFMVRDENTILDRIVFSMRDNML